MGPVLYRLALAAHRTVDFSGRLSSGFSSRKDLPYDNQALNGPSLFLFRSSYPRSVLAVLRICGIDKLTLCGYSHTAGSKLEYHKKRCRSRLLCWNHGKRLSRLGGYYSPRNVLFGFQESIFFATQACTILQWSRLSDHIGRKPIILIGLFGLSVSMYCFALSRTFWGLVTRYSTALEPEGI